MPFWKNDFELGNSLLGRPKAWEIAMGKRRSRAKISTRRYRTFAAGYKRSHRRTKIAWSAAFQAGHKLKLVYALHNIL
jgi:hypothetical protein